MGASLNESGRLAYGRLANCDRGTPDEMWCERASAGRAVLGRETVGPRRRTPNQPDRKSRVGPAGGDGNSDTVTSGTEKFDRRSTPGSKSLSGGAKQRSDGATPCPHP